MKICILAAGAGGMYCGSCLRDNALAGALRRSGHDVTLVPLYSPLRTDTPDQSIRPVFYGGVNAYLQYATRLFRHTPRLIDWLLDRRWLLKLVTRFGAQTSPAKLGAFTLSILRGDEGEQTKELRRLAGFLREDIRPDVISIPNLMFIGTARALGQATQAPLICELTGEDLFLDAMTEPWRSEAQRLIRGRAAHVDRFVATSGYYAEKMSEYLDVPRERIDVVHPGITQEHLADAVTAASAERPPTVGYFARICPEKGLERLIDAFGLLLRKQGMAAARLRVGGYIGAAHRAWLKGLQQRISREGLGGHIDLVGEVDLPGKLALLDSVDVVAVPTAYAEPKGIYVLEAMARGRPVVLPAHGAFVELTEQTGGGVLTPPGDAAALAAALAALLADAPRRRELGENGHRAVRQRFTDDHMAQRMMQVYEAATLEPSSPSAFGRGLG